MIVFQNIIRNTFFHRRVYLVLAFAALLAGLSFTLPVLLGVSQLVLLVLGILMLIDGIVLFSRSEGLRAERQLADRFSNGDLNVVTITISNQLPFSVHIILMDEVPVQFQQRDITLRAELVPNAQKSFNYQLRPVERGVYSFGNINLLANSPLRLITRRIVIPAAASIPVMPAFHAMRKYALMAVNTNLSESGNRRMRKLGHSLEFEQIKEYVRGDDVRSINWKATARKGGQLMVNHFTDERSQQVYCIIDKGRTMKMPFEGMTLLDYAINASLVLSKVALIRHDKAGLICFDDKSGQVLPAERTALQMNQIMETLYHQQTNFLDSDFEKLHALVRTRINQRSLIILFTNFESSSALERQLPYIRSMARNHLVLVIFFENTGLRKITETAAEDIDQLYIKTIAEKFAMEKRLMVKELYKYGILSVLTPPSQVTINTVNKYLELKSRQVI
jgi:uncharacterized protein (DUF58 family)